MTYKGDYSSYLLDPSLLPLVGTAAELEAGNVGLTCLIPICGNASEVRGKNCEKNVKRFEYRDIATVKPPGVAIPRGIGRQEAELSEEDGN